MSARLIAAALMTLTACGGSGHPPNPATTRALTMSGVALIPAGHFAGSTQTDGPCGPDASVGSSPLPFTVSVLNSDLSETLIYNGDTDPGKVSGIDGSCEFGFDAGDLQPAATYALTVGGQTKDVAGADAAYVVFELNN